MKQYRNINLRYVCISLLFLIFAFENCDISGPNLDFSPVNDPNSVLRSQGGVGDGFEGKPREGDWIRTFPNYDCPNTADSIQAAIAMYPTTGKIISDNCKTTNIEISKVDPSIDFAFYNPDYFTFAGSIFEITNQNVAPHVNESLCRFRNAERGVDAVITSDSSGIHAKVLTGTYTDRQSNSLIYNSITKTQSASSLTFNNADGSIRLVIQGTPQEYKNLQGTLLTNIAGSPRQYSVTCQKMSEEPVLASVPTSFATYYIDRATGTDANDGLTEAKSFYSVPRCSSIVKPGDTCVVKNGVYTESILFGTSGTAAGRITFKNYQNHKPVLNFSDTAGSARLEVIHPNYPAATMGYITIQGFEIMNGKADALKFSLGTEVVIKNNYFHDTVLGFGLSVTGYRVRIENNLFVRNGSGNGYANFGLRGQQNIIINNIFLSAGSSGMSGIAIPSSDPLYSDFRDNLIANNVFAYNPFYGLELWGTNNGVVANNRILNNIFYENCSNCVVDSLRGQGIRYLDPSGSGDLITNNLFFGTKAVTTPIGGAGNYQPAQQYTETANMFNSQNPLFVNAPASAPQSPDFHLQSTSAAIDSGTDLSGSVQSDFDGNTRPRGAGFDIGAYEL
jgi:parallel beta-helix repeat protein